MADPTARAERGRRGPALPAARAPGTRPGLAPLQALLDSLGAGSEEEARERLRVFRRLVLAYGTARSLLWWAFATGGAGESGWLLAPAGALAAAGFLEWRGPAPGRRTALLAATLGVLAQALWRAPFTANHLFLELAVLVLLCLDRGAPGDAGRVLAGLRGATALVLFHTGWQKLSYGLYSDGQFLALMIGAEERFARAFVWLVSEPEVARLVSLDRRTTGAGPYLVASPWLAWAARAVVAAELLLPAGLVWPRTRALAACGTLALLAGIEVAALEMGFAALFASCVLLFLPVAWSRRAWPALAAGLVWALLAAAGWLPGDPARWNLL